MAFDPLRDRARVRAKRAEMMEGARLRMVDYYERADRAPNERVRAENAEQAVRLKGWIAMIAKMPGADLLEFYA